MLNQTDISYGVQGHNKFYQIQLIEIEGRKEWVLYTRWGRVGAKGQSAKQKFNNLDKAKQAFAKKFVFKI